MVPMTDAGPPTNDAATEAPARPEASPGERRLARPPSDRYRAAESAREGRTRPVSPGRGLAFAAAAAIVGATAITVLGGVVTMTGGLLVVAAIIGWATAWALRAGGGTTIAARRRAYLALGLAIAGVALGQVGLWLYGRTEGGVLPLVEYLGETFGPLVPIQALIAGAVAWVVAR
jgi:hypothetical protein